MCVNIIKSYFAHMFKATKIFLLFFLVSQVAMLPVSQAFAARHHQDNYRTNIIVSVSAPSGVMTMLPHFTRLREHAHNHFLDTQNHLSDTACFSSPSHKTNTQSRCSRSNGHTGDCGSCQCSLMIDVPVLVQVTPVFIPVEFYNIHLGSPLYSVVIAPPLRPPTS